MSIKWIMTMGLALLPTAAASPAGLGKLTKNAQNMQAGNNAATGVVSELHAAHALLMKADHDYSGHRAKAAREVATAIHEITGKQHHAANKTGGKGPKIAQAMSDAHLNEAAQILTTALAKMPAGHKSTMNVQAAINEIHTALKIK